MKAYLVIMTLSNGAEIVEPATYDQCQFVFRQLRYNDALGKQVTTLHRPTGVQLPVVGFECRPAEHKDGVPSS